MTMTQSLLDVLTKDEVSFLESQGLSPFDVFDGRAISSIPSRGSLAKEAYKLIVLRDPRRSHCGHRLTTRKGHCVECDTAKIAYASRHGAPGFVYIAGSKRLGCIKIGTTQNVYQRLDNLNGQSTAGANDWRLLFYVKFERAGAVETLAHSFLPKPTTSRTTFKDGHDQEAKEIFECCFQDAYKAIARAATELGLKPTSQAWRSKDARAF